MIKEAGGPAFPVVVEGGDMSGLHSNLWEGMTLRDWFAGMALQGLITCPAASSGTKADIAIWAYSYADAMLEERKK